MRIKNLNVYFDNFCKKSGQKLELQRFNKKATAYRVIKDLYENRNWSWFSEIMFRNKDNFNSTALFYRGVEISYLEMVGKMQEYAKSLKTMGIKKGDEIPVCMSNTPEFVYLLGAISMVGAIANVFSSHFEKDYIKEIIDSCNVRTLFVEDNEYIEMNDVLKNVELDRIVMSSLSNSFANGKDKYEELDKPYERLFEDKSAFLSELDNRITTIKDFEKEGINYDGKIIEDVSLDDPFTVTYSSGTTSRRPKPIIHAVRSFNVVSRFHDHEINHTPSYRNFRMQVAIPTYSNTGLVSGISDALTQGCRLALEPIKDENFVVESLMINQPSYLDETKTMWLKFAKNILYNPKYKDVKLPSLFICFSVGEPTEANEEALINRALKKVNAGQELLKLPIPFVKLSIAGGDCEHGGYLYKLFRAYSNLNPVHKFKKETAGMGTFDMVDYAILDKDGNHCAPYEIGTLAATSVLDMIGYKNNEAANNEFYIRDIDGKTYGNCKVDSYIDLKGDIHILGRQTDDKPTYNISNVILEDRKNVLSCAVIPVDDTFVAHIEFMPECKKPGTVLSNIHSRLLNSLGEEIANKVVYRIHSFEESFPINNSGKRDNLVLIEEGISDKCFSVSELLEPSKTLSLKK